MITQADLFAKFTELNISFSTVDHPPLFTVADSQALRGKIPGGHAKNLFLKDKKGKLFLLIVEENTKIDLKTLHKHIGAQRLSFARPELLMEILGMTPGAVNPFALMNDQHSQCEAWLDRALLAHELVSFHPLKNTQTTTLSSQDLVKFLTHIQHPPHRIDFSNPGIADAK